MRNAITNETVECNPLKYNYMKLLLKEIKKHIVIGSGNDNKLIRTKTTSNQIIDDYKFWKERGWIPLIRRVRITIIDGRLYVNPTFLKDPNLGKQRLFFHGVYLYLKDLMKKYSDYIPNTDFIWHIHDKKVRSIFYEHRNWHKNSTIPYFFCDIDQSASPNYLPLFGIGREYTKYKYLGNNYFNNNIQDNRLTDYFQYLSVSQNSNFSKLFLFINKDIDKVLFAGNPGRGAFRQKLFNSINNYKCKYCKYNDSDISNYFDIIQATDPRQNAFVNIKTQLRYKYILVMDGVSVRDSFFYQMTFGAVLFKQISIYASWWHFDLKHNENIIIFESFEQLISMIKLIIDSNNNKNDILDKNQYEYLLNNNYKMHQIKYTQKFLNNLTLNAKGFIADYLKETNVDCYFLHMIQVYNQFLYDSDSITLGNDTNMVPIN